MANRPQDFFGSSPKTVLNKPFMHVQDQKPSVTDDGSSHAVYVDDTSIEKMLTVCRDMPDSSLVITEGGLWKTADSDGVDNVYVETTVGELRRMRDEMIVRGLQNWGYCDAHKKIIKAALNNKTMTPRQILDYDTYKTNWSLS